MRNTITDMAPAKLLVVISLLLAVVLIGGNFVLNAQAEREEAAAAAKAELAERKAQHEAAYAEYLEEKAEAERLEAAKQAAHAAICETIPMFDIDYQGQLVVTGRQLELLTPDGTGHPDYNATHDALEGMERPTYTVGKFTMEEVQQIVTSTCPDQQPVLDAVQGAADAWTNGLKIGGGSYIVGNGEGQMRPGTWVTTSKDIIEDCYWERTSGSSGNIIDNYISSAASQVTVTVRDGETFTSNRCGGWKRV